MPSAIWLLKHYRGLDFFRVASEERLLRSPWDLEKGRLQLKRSVSIFLMRMAYHKDTQNLDRMYTEMVIGIVPLIYGFAQETAGFYCNFEPVEKTRSQ